ncbi:MAG TPA: response regulator transcription factor [Opitutaceae bacterium]|nr:response regulator transcription factor [Opitutaceae bacterium]
MSSSHPAPEHPAEHDALTPSDVEYWRHRLVRRRYTEFARPNELFARIEYESDWAFFPLGSDQSAAAAEKAREIYLAVVRDGWPAVRRTFVWEFTVGVFWLTDPLAATYSTLFTRPEADGEPDGKLKGATNVIVIEPAPEVRQALVALLNQTSGYHCMSAVGSVRDVRSLAPAERPEIVLLNQHVRNSEEEDPVRRVQRLLPKTSVFNYSIYRNSDELFVTITGVDGGYFLRRRLPENLLDPVHAPPGLAAPFGEGARTRVRSYFGGLIHASANGTEQHSAPTLTNREYEILTWMSRGLTNDKAIADALQISAWTVSAHLKSIFRKLNVHSRTEAVMKFLQR